MENRTSTRVRSFLGAKIILQGGFSVFDCIVKDISPSGARLAMQSSIIVPEAFRLKISDGRSFDVEVQWRRIGAVGVKFLNAPA